MSNEIVKKEPEAAKPRIGGFGGGLAAKKKAAIEATEKEKDPRTVATLPPEEMPHRIGIEMDDSGSMSGRKIQDAHDGIEEFLRCCKPTDTAIAIYPMNESPIKLNTQLPATAILVRKIRDSGSTPLVRTLKNMLENESLTRGIVFSDGSPDWNDRAQVDEAIAICIEKKIPIDTVFICGSYADAVAEEFMKNLAERTGGIFMKFEAGKSTFKNSFKYLAPGTRAMLMDEETRKKVERGESI